MIYYILLRKMTQITINTNKLDELTHILDLCKSNDIVVNLTYNHRQEPKTCITKRLTRRDIILRIINNLDTFSYKDVIKQFAYTNKAFTYTDKTIKRDIDLLYLDGLLDYDMVTQTRGGKNKIFRRKDGKQII